MLVTVAALFVQSQQYDHVGGGGIEGQHLPVVVYWVVALGVVDLDAAHLVPVVVKVDPVVYRVQGGRVGVGLEALLVVHVAALEAVWLLSRVAPAGHRLPVLHVGRGHVWLSEGHVGEGGNGRVKGRDRDV